MASVLVLSHAERARPFGYYCLGLISAEGRKRVETRTAVLRRVRERVLPSVTREEPAQACTIDDTGYPKKGSHSVGVTRQYCGQVGNQKTCQIAVSLSAATHQGSLPVAYRLYLPKDSAEDPVRRTKAGVPDDVTFQTKPEIALQSPTRATMFSSTTLSSSRRDVHSTLPFWRFRTGQCGQFGLSGAIEDASPRRGG